MSPLLVRTRRSDSSYEAELEPPPHPHPDLQCAGPWPYKNYPHPPTSLSGNWTHAVPGAFWRGSRPGAWIVLKRRVVAAADAVCVHDVGIWRGCVRRRVGVYCYSLRLVCVCVRLSLCAACVCVRVHVYVIFACWGCDVCLSRCWTWVAIA